ncbi:MAG: PD-(D/E)XK nuclease family protein [Saprospiraceae bacterium]|nr:PD-(D/E)XK nuclease family protein [Saprospiraceae bacterium]
MKLIFGLNIDDSIHLSSSYPDYYFNPFQLIHYLEKIYNLPSINNDLKYIQIEWYRQSISEYTKQNPQSFCVNSFNSDEFGTANYLFEMREELIVAGFDFERKYENPSERISFYLAVEKLYNRVAAKSKYQIISMAQRKRNILNLLNDNEFPFVTITLIEPFHLLPPYWMSFFDILKLKGVEIIQHQNSKNHQHNDLSKIAALLNANVLEKFTFKVDGSFFLIKSNRDTEMAKWLAQFCTLNKTFSPQIIIEKNHRTLESAIIAEGLPALGIKNASFSRPLLQMLKLVQSFLWRPLNPTQLLQFVTLPLKPLDFELAIVIAKQIANYPGLDNEFLKSSVENFFNSITDLEKLERLKLQYKWWFERKRFDINSFVPINEVIDLYAYILAWTFNTNDNSTADSASIKHLQLQIQRIIDVLEEYAQHSNFLSALQLERMISTIEEDAKMIFKEAEIGHYPFVLNAGAAFQSMEKRIWWQFEESRSDLKNDFWKKDCKLFFEKNNINFDSTENQILRNNFAELLAFNATTEQFILTFSDHAEGEKIYPNNILKKLESFCYNLNDITIDINNPNSFSKLAPFFQIPESEQIDLKPITKPKLSYTIPAYKPDSSNVESFTSLKSLIYYPYQWYFNTCLLWKPTEIWKISSDMQLKGNLAHRIVQFLTKENYQSWTTEELYAWIENRIQYLLIREGAPLLMYGKEPERIKFINDLKYAIHSLLSSLRNDKWTIVANEKKIETSFWGMNLKGFIDLIIENQDHQKCVIDLKWSSIQSKINEIKSNEDLQLVLYSKYISDDDTQVIPAAYYSLLDAKFATRYANLFSDVTIVKIDDDPHSTSKLILEKLRKTIQWRNEQFNDGFLEVRHDDNIDDLDQHYDNLLDLLELKPKSDKYCQFKVLTGNVK